MAYHWKSSLRLGGALLLTGVLAMAQGFGTNYSSGRVAQPGAVNYVEGSVTLNGTALSNRSIGTAELEPGQQIQTGAGKAEVLLTPGVFVRLDDNSQMRMLSNSLTNTEVQLDRGRALIEVDLIAKENHLAMIDQGATVTFEKKGIYEVDANTPSAKTFDGKAVVRVNDQSVDVNKGKELALNETGKLKPVSFDRNNTDDLYAWSKLRSQYMAEANAASAQTIVVNNPGWYYGTGWYWNPWFSSWAFVPGAGYLYSPFGFGFYSPLYYSYFPGYYGYRPGFGYRPGTGFRPGFGAHPAPGFRVNGGFHSAAPPVGGGGVHFGGIGRR